jgi:hypothetical protein
LAVEAVQAVEKRRRLLRFGALEVVKEIGIRIVRAVGL